jgi:hypothetical protein
MATDSFLVKADNKDIFPSFPYEECTPAALEDELLKSFLSSKKNQQFYYAQAEYFLRRINIYDPLPVFVLHDEDVPEGLAEEIGKLDEKTAYNLITDVVRRIYETIDSDYYHINGIYGKVKWFILKDNTAE